MSQVQNIEMKANCENPDRIRNTLQGLGADFEGADRQIDTYYNVNQGRMKLREGDIENYLIHYERPDQEGPKEARIMLYETDPGTDLKQLLEAALGHWCVVRKSREIYYIENVKFHIDSVEELGSFVEIEAIDRTGDLDKETLRDQCNHYMDRLEINSDQLIDRSYSDLITD